MRPIETIARFDAFLAGEGLQLEVTVVGGAALGLLGVTSRETRDCDVLEPPLPEEILAAARRFAAVVRTEGSVLRDDWLNNGPASLSSVLPPGWRGRLQLVFKGRVLIVHTLAREDLLTTKLFALCDRGLDLADCVALAPTADELAGAVHWLEQQDLNPDWPAHVRETVADLGRRLGHGL